MKTRAQLIEENEELKRKLHGANVSRGKLRRSIAVLKGALSEAAKDVKATEVRATGAEGFLMLQEIEKKPTR